jgi:hypothetical protein
MEDQIKEISKKVFYEELKKVVDKIKRPVSKNGDDLQYLSDIALIEMLQ